MFHSFFVYMFLCQIFETYIFILKLTNSTKYAPCFKSN